MSNRTFQRKQALEKEVKDIYYKGTYVAKAAAAGTWDLTTDVAVSAVATGSSRNTDTVTLDINAAAANLTDTVLAEVTGTAAAVNIAITPNDGTNNSSVPVNLTTAEVAELVASGAVAGKTVTVTDGGGLLTDLTASGGDATVVVNSGEGDGVVATLAAGTDASSFSSETKWGISSITESSTGTFRIVLKDKYHALKFIDVLAKSASEEDLNFQIKAEDVNGSSPYIDFYSLTGGSKTSPANGDVIKCQIELKNTSII